MSDQPDKETRSAPPSDPLLLEYDYFKHLSTIGLVALGAMLTWGQGHPATSRTMFMVSLSLVAISVTLGFGAMNEVIEHRKRGRPLRWLFRWERVIASALFATGLGLFMSEAGRVLT